jgi:lysozyme family protein
MGIADELRESLEQAVSELTARGFQTTDPTEQQQIDQQITLLDRKIQRLNQMQLLEAAVAVSDAAEDLAPVVRSARTGPFDQYVERMRKLIGTIKVTEEKAVNDATGEVRHFPKTENPETDTPLPPPHPEPASPPDPVQPPPAVARVVNSTTFANLKAEYEAEWANCQIRDDKRGTVEGVCVATLNANTAKYQQVAAQFPGMPWYFIGVIHAMETGFRFNRHLHNGDPLSAKTVRVPKGRPISGNPPFSWEVSAKDAMEHMGYNRETDWSLAHVLYLLEKYNGFGYRFKGLRTPYLWSYSNLYSKGRYVADGVFDPHAVSPECGAATMLKALL